ncbi:uncharacterized protein LOC129608018 isoform X2 [Condylostylus longicornis]|uniref:uncharacterized protein LOC129608018 isoform X2 n=1 Tax=Condylostylus longicornis TaxID=2530218 RepID=UPI00244E3C5D|nr:uncharacterized protein LOC129608018 isoform X2 [Condylostylus longicornis]
MFPKDKKILEKWIIACNRSDKFSIKNARVCSDHFTEDDWRLQDILMNIPKGNRKLKKDAIPSKNLPFQIELLTIMERQEKWKKKKIKALVQDIEMHRLDLEGGQEILSYKNGLSSGQQPEINSMNVGKENDAIGSVLHEEEIEYLNNTIESEKISNNKTDVQTQTECDAEFAYKLKIEELEKQLEALKNLDTKCSNMLACEITPKERLIVLNDLIPKTLIPSRGLSPPTCPYSVSKSEFETIWF